MQPIEVYNKKAIRFFTKILKENVANNECKISIVIVTHILPDRPALLTALARHYHIAGIIPKTKSIDYKTLESIQSNQKMPLFDFTRDSLLDSHCIDSIIGAVPPENSLCILDIGGYFFEAAEILKEKMGDRFIGVIEDTENGYQKYSGAERSYPVMSAARSPLKEPEDFLVGRSVLFSTDALLRDFNDLIANKNVLVLGYGKIGKSIANGLSSNNVNVSVYDTDAIRQAQARSHGYAVGKVERSLQDYDLLFCATGGNCLSVSDFAYMKNGVFIASVTSADDEFGDLSDPSTYERVVTDSSISIFTNRKNKKRVFLLNEGNAVNFIHNAVVGPYIYLVQSELVLSISRILGEENGVLAELDTGDRQYLASEWLTLFNGG